MGFAIIRQEKIKGAKSFNSRTEHNDRTFLTPNIQKKLTHKNITLFKNQYKNYDDFVATKKEELRLNNLAAGTKNRFPRKLKNEDAALNQEFVISSSNKSLGELENIEYLKDAHDFLIRAFETRENRIADYAFDDQGNLSFGIPDHTLFKDQKYDPDIGIFGMDVCITMEKPGYRVKRRRIQRRKIHRNHRLEKEETIKFFTETFNLEVVK